MMRGVSYSNFGPPGGFVPPGGPMVPGSVQRLRLRLPLGLAIASMGLFWGIGTLTGIAGLVLCALASRRMNMGDVEGAHARSRAATLVQVAGMVATLALFAVLYFTGVLRSPF